MEHLPAIADEFAPRLPQVQLALQRPGQVGLVSIRVQIPEDLPAATELPVTAFVNGRSSNTVLLPLR